MKNNDQKPEFLFENVNYKFLLIGIGVIALGFILMSGGGSDDPKVFNEAVFSFRRIRLAPTVVLIGFGITIYSIFKGLEKSYEGDGSYDTIVRHFIDGLKTELRKQLNVEKLETACTILTIEFIISGYYEMDVSKPRIESWTVLSGTIQIEGGGQLTTGEFKKWTNIVNGEHTFGGCWIGRAEFISHLVTHNNSQMPPIQGQYELLSLADAVDYTKFLVDFTCDYQRFAAMVPDCGKPIISSTLTPEYYEEQIIK